MRLAAPSRQLTDQFAGARTLTKSCAGSTAGSLDAAGAE
jgi:hypothetical protein